MLKPVVLLLLYLNRGQILLWVGSTHHAAGDVALVSQNGAAVAASGGGKRTLGNSLTFLASAVALAGADGPVVPTRISGTLHVAVWVSNTLTSLFQPQHLNSVFPITA